MPQSAAAVQVWELWPYLTAGAGSWLPDEEARVQPAALLAWWAAQGITVRSRRSAAQRPAEDRAAARREAAARKRALRERRGR